MLIKIVALFLVAMAVLAVFGRLRMPRLRPPPGRTALRPPAPVICLKCGTPIPGPGECPCGGAGRAGPPAG